jgi:uncharacterized protein YecT (DUF1311 family)
MIRIISLLALALTSIAAFGQETLAVAKTQFAKADRELNEVWAEVQKKMPAARFKILKPIQRDWLVFRHERAETAALAGQPEKAQAQDFPAYFTTATRLTEDRIARLRRLAKFEDEPLTGAWIDGNGGSVDIVEQKGRLLFEFHVVRGRGHDVGAISGVAAWNRGIGWFSDKGQRDKDDAGETNFVFIAREMQQLEIISANAQDYHGHHAYFDGTYFKAASLTPEEEAATVRAGESGKLSSE